MFTWSPVSQHPRRLVRQLDSNLITVELDTIHTGVPVDRDSAVSPINVHVIRVLNARHSDIPVIDELGTSHFGILAIHRPRGGVHLGQLPRCLIIFPRPSSSCTAWEMTSTATDTSRANTISKTQMGS
jgi:hypothetical protein